MEDYNKFLMIMERGVPYTEEYLISKSRTSKETIEKALSDKMIFKYDKNQYGKTRYKLTNKGFSYCNN